jgi:hypothetical protein
MKYNQDLEQTLDTYLSLTATQLIPRIRRDECLRPEENPEVDDVGVTLDAIEKDIDETIRVVSNRSGLQRQALFREQYSILAQVGKGRSSVVYLTLDKVTGEQDAVKLFTKSAEWHRTPRLRSEFLKEIRR